MYNLKEFKARFDPILEDFLDKRLEEFTKLTSDEFVKVFTTYSKKLAMASGKRVRPYLAYLCYSAFGGKNENAALKLLVSLEIFHTFALIHDDIMDRASTRHGIKTVNKFILEELKKGNGFGDLNHISNSQSILLGDLLFSISADVFEKGLEDFEKENFIKARSYFYKMVDEVILGQMLDVDITTRDRADESLINEKTRLKTSRYTCVRPMQIGAALANPNYDKENLLEDLGTRVGIAFQMQDDLLSIIGDFNSLTKDILIDVEEHQHTFFTNYIFEKGTDEQKNEFKNFFGKKIKDEDKESVKNLFVKSGAIEDGKKIISDSLNQARNIIEGSDFEKKYKICFLELIDVIEARQN